MRSALGWGENSVTTAARTPHTAHTIDSVAVCKRRNTGGRRVKQTAEDGGGSIGQHVTRANTALSLDHAVTDLPQRSRKNNPNENGHGPVRLSTTS